MLETILVILLVLWLIGLVSGNAWKLNSFTIIGCTRCVCNPSVDRQTGCVSSTFII